MPRLRPSLVASTTSRFSPLALRQPPANLEAEQALLGGLLANNRGLETVEEFLKPDHFADPVHADIYRTICARVAQGRIVDATSIRDVFANDPRLESAGGDVYLAGLITAMVTVRYLAEYGRAIVDAWTRRALIDVLGGIVERCFIPGDDPATRIVDDLEAGLLRVAEGVGDTDPTVSVAEAVSMAVQAAREASERASPLAGLSTGYAALDRMTMGLLGPGYYVLAARPSMGKTGLGLGIAVRAAASGVPVLFWSGEMSAPQLGARMAAAKARLPTTAVFTGRRWDVPADAAPARPQPLPPSQWADLRAVETQLGHVPLHFDMRPAISVHALRARARRMRRSSQGLGLVVIDYLGLMRGSDEARRLGRYAEVTEISAAIKMMAKELGVPVLVLAQLNRANEARDDKTPTLADLRDSGAVEQDADGVMFIHRPHYYLTRQGRAERKPRESDEDFANRMSDLERRTREAEGVANVLVAKNRHGPTGSTRLRFEDETTWFYDESDAPGDAWASSLGGA